MESGSKQCALYARHKAGLLLPVLALSWAGMAQATNGYFAHGYSVAQRAMGGAGTAYSEDALAASSNPANIAFLPQRLDFNLGLFAPVRSYTASERGAGAGPGIVTLDPGQQRSRNERFAIPAVGYSHPLDDRTVWGIALYGNGGMNTDYAGGSARFGQGLTGFETQCDGAFGGGAPTNGASDNAGFCGNGLAEAGVDLIQVFIVPSVAYRLGEASSIGFAPVVAAQRFSAKGLKAFARFSNAPDQVSDNGNDYSRGMGYRLGFTLGVIPHTAIGASYQSRIGMTKFDQYAGLFADEGNFDIPSTWNLGVAVELPHRQRVLVDYQRVQYSEVTSVGNPLDPNRFINDCALPRIGGSTAPSEACLGSATGPGFGWQDVSTLKFGYEIALETLRLRGGYSLNRQPIPGSEVLFNVLAPGVPQEHFTLGVAYPLGPKWGLEVGAAFARNYAVTGKNPISNAEATEGELFSEVVTPGSGNTEEAFGSDPDDQDITLQMRQYEITVGLSYHF